MPCQVVNVLGPAGAGNTDSSDYVVGRVQMYYIEYITAGAGTTTTITDADTGFVLLTVAGNANGHWLPRYACVDTLNAAIYYDLAGAPANQGEQTDCFYSTGNINVAIAGAGAAANINVHIFYSDFK